EEDSIVLVVKVIEKNTGKFGIGAGYNSEETIVFPLILISLIGKLRGQATGSLEIKGNYTSPDLYLSALIEDVQLEKVPLNSIKVKLDKIGSVVRINQLKLSQRKGELVAGGWINLDEDNKNLDIHLSADNVDLSQLSNLFGFEEEIKGLASFKAEINGDINSPTVFFLAQVEKGKVSDFYFDKFKVDALYNQDILEVKQFVLDKEGHKIIFSNCSLYL
ncbi:unnamed protein product, partial [marine sediment metagenome]